MSEKEKAERKEEEKEKRQPFKFTIKEEDKLVFPEIGEFAFTTSSDLTKIVDELFHVFDDFANIKYIPSRTVNGVFYEPSFTIAFKNNIYPKDSKIIHGVEPAIKEIENGADYVQMIQTIDNRKQNAGKFIATEDLKDIIKKYLSPIYFNNGKINWGRICNNIALPTNNTLYARNYTQYTVFEGLAARNFVHLLYKKTDPDARYTYIINQGIPQQMVDNFGRPMNTDNYTLQICRTNVKNFDALMKYYGMNNNDGWIRPFNS